MDHSMKGEYRGYCNLQEKHAASQGAYDAEFKKQEGPVSRSKTEIPYQEMNISADGHAALVQPATNPMTDGRNHGNSRHAFCDKHPYAYPSHEDTTNHRNMVNDAFRDSDEAAKNLEVHRQHRHSYKIGCQQ